VFGRREDTDSEFAFGSQNFLDEERQEDRVSLHRTIVRWGLAFLTIFCCIAIAFWWSGSAIGYSTARVQQRSKPTYQITGVITDSRTHQPVAWAEISTDFQFGGAFFSTNADQEGRYAITTLAEPHDLVIKANGYQSARLHVGKQWFSWTPRGSEQRNLELMPDR
jgi:hypothetical protein